MKGNFIREHSHIQSHFLLSLGSLAAFFLAGKGRTSPTGAVVKADSEPIALVAAPGRVEPVSEEIKISSDLRVRVDVDETDVSRIEMNQQAYVIADAFGDKK